MACDQVTRGGLEESICSLGVLGAPRIRVIGDWDLYWGSPLMEATIRGQFQDDILGAGVWAAGLRACFDFMVPCTSLHEYPS